MNINWFIRRDFADTFSQGVHRNVHETVDSAAGNFSIGTGIQQGDAAAVLPQKLQHQLDGGAFSGTVTKIGLARTNPHRDIVSFRLAP